MRQPEKRNCPKLTRKATTLLRDAPVRAAMSARYSLTIEKIQLYNFTPNQKRAAHFRRVVQADIRTPTFFSSLCAAADSAKELEDTQACAQTFERICIVASADQVNKVLTGSITPSLQDMPQDETMNMRSQAVAWALLPGTCLPAGDARKILTVDSHTASILGSLNAFFITLKPPHHIKAFVEQTHAPLLLTNRDELGSGRRSPKP